MNGKKLFIYFIVAVIFIVGIWSMKDEIITQEANYIRFHVIANSDSPEDQALKLRVRDRLLKEFGKSFGNVESLEDCRQKITENIDKIQKIAEEEVKKSGKSYTVAAQLGRFEFPTKAYGDLVLPAGTYEALRVVIGKGQGSNWWCVMFPPLCFVDISHGVARNAVSGSEVETVADGASEMDYEVEAYTDTEEYKPSFKIEYKFKLVEWWKEWSHKMNHIFTFARSND